MRLRLNIRTEKSEEKLLTESLELVVDDLFGCSTRELDRQREEKSHTHRQTDMAQHQYKTIR